MSLPFAGADATLNDTAKRQLEAVAARAVKDESLRLQLLAYASGGGEAANSARRLSLSRALAVRSYLIDKGVRSTRIDVRALGNRLEGGGDPDRVDVIVGAK
jgi:outer membrane protein OmpA-like peptidoglycan-associated protein